MFDSDLGLAYRLRIEDGLPWPEIAARVGRSNPKGLVQAVSLWAKRNALPSINMVRPDLRAAMRANRIDPLRGISFENAVAEARRAARKEKVRPERQKAKRLCLRCRRYFDSAGIGNRLCNTCSHTISLQGSSLDDEGYTPADED